MRILVTGADGLLGGDLMACLASRRGWDIVPLGGPKCVRQGLIPVDLAEVALTKVFYGDLFDAVVHCAAGIPESHSDSRVNEIAKLNSRIDDNLLQFCRRAGTRLLYLSSTSIYAKDNFCHAEGLGVSPQGPYAEAKLTSEKAVTQLLGRASAVFRISSPYGPGQRTMNVLKRFCMQALNGEDLVLFGKGDRCQDFLFCRDFSRAAECLLAGSNGWGEAYNITSHKPTSMYQLAREIISLVPESRSRILYAASDPDAGFVPDYPITKAQEILKWTPVWSLNEGLEKCLKAWR